MASPAYEFENMQLLVDSIPALIHTARPDGFLDYFNKPWLQYLGVTLDQVAGWNWTAFIHPEDLEGILARWRACLANGEIFEYETRVRRANGEYHWMFHRKVPLRDANGNIAKWYGSSLDIDERKTAEEQLRRNSQDLQRSEFYLAEGQRLAHMGSWVFEPAGFFSYWAKELFQIYGLDPAHPAPTLEDYLACVHPQDREFMRSLIKQMVTESLGCDVTKRIVRPSGEVRYIRCVGNPISENGKLLRILSTAIDVTDNELLTQELRRREAYLAEAQRLSHTGSFGWKPDTGEIVWSEETYCIFEYDRSVKPTIDSVVQRVHLEDRADFQKVIDGASRGTTDFEHAYRLLFPDGRVKHVHAIAHVLRDTFSNREFVGAVTDITEQCHAEALAAAEKRLLEMIATGVALQEILNALCVFIEDQRSGTLASVLLLDPDGLHLRFAAGSKLTDEWIQQMEKLPIGPCAGSCGTAAYRRSPVIVSDIANDPLWNVPEHRASALKHGLRASWSNPVLSSKGNVLGTFCMYYSEPRSPEKRDLELIEVATHLVKVAIERDRAEEALRNSEAYLAEAQRLARMGSWVWQVAGREALHLSDEWYRIYGFDPTLGPPRWEERLQRAHPEDRAKWQGTIERAIQEKSDYDVEFRILLPDGTIRWVHTFGHPVLSPAGELVQFVGSTMDVTERKMAEGKIREQEAELRQILDFTPQYLAVLGADGSPLYANRASLDYIGMSLDQWLQRQQIGEEVHPDDLKWVASEMDRALSTGSPVQIEERVRKGDGSFRWFLTRCNPVRDGTGQITRLYLASTDINDRKSAEERLQQENVALREEIDKAWMFEEIVGTSPALKSVLSHIFKVAPSDSTVLITGETGTGKELVARAIHRRSKRVSGPFVSVNCAAIPRDLIASELFGHEKGAFTGATQQRLGRFELASGGTIFLDEVGELPAETQMALLRVLQEHEFERVGGTRPIHTDVRVIAATNRDLQAAISTGFFRSDLFYRLNVFPIEIPSLRERKEDIPLLVEYFIERYARKAGKNIRHVNKKTFQSLQSYPWPGNIRELQNVIERSVILCETDIFSVDESWLPLPLPATGSKRESELPLRLEQHERELIEEALKASRGRVFGPTGAAARLGIPRSTLESKIRSLKIDKNRFRTQLET